MVLLGMSDASYREMGMTWCRVRVPVACAGFRRRLDDFQQWMVGPPRSGRSIVQRASLPDYLGDAILGLLLSGVLLIASGVCVKPMILPGNVVLEREDLDISEAFRELKPDDGIDI